jgi:hypothetical protein
VVSATRSCSASTWGDKSLSSQPSDGAAVEALNYGVGGYGTDQFLMSPAPRSGARRTCVLAEVDLPQRQPLPALGARDLRLRRAERSAGGSARDPNPFPGEEGARRHRDRASPGGGAERRAVRAAGWRNPLYDRSHLVRLASTVASRVWQSHLRPDRFHQGDEISRDSQAFAVLVAIVRAFAREVENAGGSFVLMIFPARDEDIWGSARRGYAPLIDALPGITVLDLADALSVDPELTPATLRVPGGHYSPAANAATADALLELLRARGLL